MSREAMKLALEALERCGSESYTIEQQAITALREVLANEALDKKAENARELGLDYEPAQQEPEFITHSVEQPYDWSEWVCPDPKSYLMKCCDCGLVHEAQFRVAKYQPSPSDECDVVDDPDLQAQFRMRRSEQWSPVDTAHRAGGLPMEQPAQQEPVAWIDMSQWPPIRWRDGMLRKDVDQFDGQGLVLSTSPPAQRTWVGLTHGEYIEAEKAIWDVVSMDDTESKANREFYRAIEAKLKEKNT